MRDAPVAGTEGARDKPAVAPTPKPTPPGGDPVPARPTLATHHAAVVFKVDAKNHELKIFEQNCNGRKTVGEATVRLDDLKAGWLRIYQPIPAEKK